MIVPAIYATLSSDALLLLVVKAYGISKDASIVFVKRGFNDTYIISPPGQQPLVLRVYKHNWKMLEHIQTEVTLLNLLKENGIAVSFPIADKNNGYIQTIEAPEGTRYMVLFSYASGACVRKLSDPQAFLLGVQTGKMHAVLKNKSLGSTPFKYDFSTQFKDITAIISPLLKDYPQQLTVFNRIKNDFFEKWQTVDASAFSVGICHGDLQAENFHIENDNITFFDFDFLGEGALVYDIGVFVWYDHKNKSHQIIESYLKGYQTQALLTITELQLLPYFSTLRALFQMALHCRISDGKQQPLWPKEQVAAFINKAAQWFEQQKLIYSTENCKRLLNKPFGTL